MALKFFNRKENKIQSIYFQIFAYKYIYNWLFKSENYTSFISAIILN